MNHCEAPDATKMAAALDSGNMTDVKSILTDCVNELRKTPENYPDLQKFMEMSSEGEQKGVGLDLTLKYGSEQMADILMGFKIDDAEKK